MGFQSNDKSRNACMTFFLSRFFLSDLFPLSSRRSKEALGPSKLCRQGNGFEVRKGIPTACHCEAIQ